MYYEDFGLKRNPFASVRNEDHIFVSSILKQSLSKLKEALEEMEMLAMYGNVGVGKSTITGEFLEMLYGDSSYQVSQIVSPDKAGLTISNIEAALIEDISDERPRRNRELRARQLHRLLGEASKRKKIVLLIDDADLLHGQTLRALKRLMELRFARRERLLTIILVGQPSLAHKMEMMKEVGLRTRFHEVCGFSKSEALAYLESRMKYAGAKLGEVFEKEVIESIIHHVGTPLELNRTCRKIMERALLAGRDRVTRDDLEDGGKKWLTEAATHGETTKALGRALQATG